MKERSIQMQDKVVLIKAVKLKIWMFKMRNKSSVVTLKIVLIKYSKLSLICNYLNTKTC